MKRKVSIIVSVVLTIALLLTGCFSQGTDTKKEETPKKSESADTSSAAPAPAPAPAPSKDRKVINVNNKEEPGFLHPGLAEGNHDSWILDHVFEGLTKRTPEGKIVPGMAKEWKVSSDNLTYTFTLRDDAKWSNGDPVTAQDFEAEWKFVLRPATASTYAFQLYYLKGGEALNTSKETDAAKLKALEDAVGVKALDDKTLEIKLEKPVPYFIELLAFYTYYPVNKKVAEANKDWNKDASTFVSNGPFKLVEWKHKDSIKILKNEGYYDKDKVKLDEINFAMIANETTAWQMYRSGQIDLDWELPQEVIPQLSAEKNPELIIGDELAVYFYRLNTTRKPFNNIKVRQALAMSLDRKALVEQVAQGGQRPAFGIVPTGIPEGSGDFQKNTGNLFEENVEKAKQLLTEGLKEEKVTKFSPTITYNNGTGHKKIAEAIQEMWRKNLGIDVKVENVEFQIKNDREHKLDYDISRAGWIGDYVDPMTFLDMWDSKSTQNDTGWKSAEYDKLINTAKTTMDPAERMKLLHEAEKTFISALPVVPIYYYTRPYTVKPYLKGVFKPVNRDPQMTYADIVK